MMVKAVFHIYRVFYMIFFFNFWIKTREKLVSLVKMFGLRYDINSDVTVGCAQTQTVLLFLLMQSGYFLFFSLFLWLCTERDFNRHTVLYFETALTCRDELE